MDAPATFTLGDSTYEVVPTRDMDYDEGQLVKQLTGGMSLGAYERGLGDGDPDAWFAQVFISLRRTNRKITREQVLELMRNQPGGVVAIFRSVTETEQEDEPDPPASRRSSDGAGNGNDANAGANEHSPLEATLETPGSRT